MQLVSSPIERNSPQRSFCGFTLIEVLVALVVLSIGMLGIGSMYVQTLGTSRTTRLRAQAVNLMTDIADRVRVNRLAQGAYEGPAADNGCDPDGGADCTPDQMAAQDLLVWQAQLAELLPGGEGAIDFNGATDPPTYTIQVSWEEVGRGRLEAQIDIQVPNT